MQQALPRKIDSGKYCILEYTPEQRRYLNTRSIFSPLPKTPPMAIPVPGDPHAMTISVGFIILPEGGEKPYIVTEHVPGVLVASEEFVTGYHYGVLHAYEASQDGNDALSEQEIINTFIEEATDTIMLDRDELPAAFSTGFLFGYMYGCTMIGTPAFQKWIEDDFKIMVQ